jgi:hypothetical protein
MTTTTITNEVDTLGQLLAQIEALNVRANAIKDAIKDDASLGGDKVRDGELFRATYSESNRSSVNTKKLYAELGITPEQIARYTTTTAVYTVKVTSL